MILYNSKENIKSLLFYLSEKTGAGCHANTWPVQECACVLCLWDKAFCICDFFVFCISQTTVVRQKQPTLGVVVSGLWAASVSWASMRQLVRLLLSTRHFTSRPKKLQILLLFLYIRYLSPSEATDKVAIVNQIFHIKGNSAVVNLIFASNYVCVCVCVCVGGEGDLKNQVYFLCS